MEKFGKPFLIVPHDATDEDRAKLAAQAAREGREMMQGLAPSFHQRRAAEWTASTPTCSNDPKTVLANLDAIARGELRPVNPEPEK